MAVFSLPPEMFLFYKQNIEFLEQHAVDPDKRRYLDKSEAPRHYIDLDHYLPDSITSLKQEINNFMPMFWDAAVERYSEDTLNANGILPWILNLRLYQLTQAFHSGDATKILRLSAEIGHYAADGHVPLHTTENYNGQLTGQHGIHALWESRIPEQFATEYDFLAGSAAYLEMPQQAIWQVIVESHVQVQGVLKDELAVRDQLKPDQWYRQQVQGRAVKKTYSETYINAYERRTGELVEKRMTASSHFIANLWYTAWVNAGQPELPVEKFIEKEEPDNLPGSESDHAH